MKKFQALTSASLLVLALLTSPVAAFTPMLTVTISNPAITNGTRVLIGVGGDGCNCTVNTTAKFSGGSATVTFSLNGCHPNPKCRVFATALDMKGTTDDSDDVKYKGNGGITPTAGGDYKSSFNINPY
jgi:hypothetical protein